MYEQSLQERDAPLDAYLNLAVLYWNCLDFGFLSYWHLSGSFLDQAAERYEAILLEAEKRFGYRQEIEFWRLYFPFALIGDPPFEEKCKALVAENSESLAPYFYLYSASEGQQYAAEANQLLADCRLTPTTKNRYIISVIEAQMQRVDYNFRQKKRSQ